MQSIEHTYYLVQCVRSGKAAVFSVPEDKPAVWGTRLSSTAALYQCGDDYIAFSVYLHIHNTLSYKAREITMTPSKIAIHTHNQPGIPGLAPNKAPTAIATPNSEDGSQDSSRPGTMPYTCQSCSRRKVKCDKTLPACLRCSKSNSTCIYQAPPPRQPRKRKHVEDVYERLARYEKILKENGLLSKAENFNSPGGNNEGLEEEGEETGKLLSSNGKSRYLNGSLWLHVGEIDISEDEDEIGLLTEDPVSGALLGISQNLLHCHPGHEDAMKLWRAHVQNVEPLIKVLHVPTTGSMIEMVSQQPVTASKAQECLLFAIYHFAVFSMTEEECECAFGRSRTDLLGIYQGALRQALVNASWLKTTKIPVLQAYVLFLISIRTLADPHIFWILTGIGTRIGQRSEYPSSSSKIYYLG